MKRGIGRREGERQREERIKRVGGRALEEIENDVGWEQWPCVRKDDHSKGHLIIWWNRTNKMSIKMGRYFFGWLHFALLCRDFHSPEWGITPQFFWEKTFAFVKIEQNELSTRDVINTEMNQICLTNLNLFSIWEQCSKTFQVRNIRMIIIS